MVRKVVALVALGVLLVAPTGAAAGAAGADAPLAAVDAKTETAQVSPGQFAGVEPTMWPPAEKVAWHNDGVRHNNYADCRLGLLCLDVVDPTRHTYKVFYLRSCTVRALHHWRGTGYPEFINNQTPGTVARFLDRNGKLLFSSTAYNVGIKIDWDPVYYIDVC